MGAPSEPLLPVDSAPPSRARRWIAIGGAVAVVLGLVAVLVVRRGVPPPPDPASSPAAGPSGSRAAAPEAGRRNSDASRTEDADDRRARELYQGAEAFERAQPADREQRMARWRAVVTQHPTTSWAKKADDRLRAATLSLQTLLDREFEGTRERAQTLAAAGRFVDAIQTLRSYGSSQTRDLLKRRSEVEISAIENASRLAYNEAASQARGLAAKGDFAGAMPLFESLSAGAIPDVAARCRTSIEQLRAAAVQRERFEGTRKGDDARRAFGEEVAPRILGLVRARRYDDALKELSAAAAAPANASIKDDITAERASLVDASAFWEAFLKALRARTGQEASVMLSDGRKLTGKIARVLEDRIVVESGETMTDAPLDRLHADLLVGWTLGKTLAAEEGLTYVKAALFFFCEGRDDLARLYLATARELNGPAEPAEKVYRSGFLRAAIAAKK